MLAHVILENLRHQAVDGAARRGQEMHHVGAVGVALEGALDGFDLAANAADAVEQLLLVADGVSHAGLPDTQ